MDELQPLGIGTSDCESLSSFVQRLAQEHGTLPGQFVFRIFSWLETNQSGKIGQWAPHPGRVRIGFNNNSFSHADVWLRSLQRFTRRADLVALTTRHWDHLFPTRGFQQGSLVWCPFCLAEDAEPFHRLAWSLQPVRMCTKHRVVLQHKCMRCGKVLPVIHDRSLITICPWCAGDLRSADPDLAKVGGETFDYWAASEVGACVAYASAWQRALNWEPVPALKAICSRRNVSTPTALARAIGTSKLTTWYWLTGKARPCLGSVLRVYFRFGLSLAEHVFKGTLADSKGADGQQHELNLRNARHARRIDWQEIKKRMLAELHVPLRDAPTLIAVAGSLGIARRTLRANQPKLCLQLAKRHRRRRKAEGAARARMLANQIKRTLRRFAERGAVPQWREIEKALRRPGLFNSHYARRVLQECLRELAGD